MAFCVLGIVLKVSGLLPAIVCGGLGLGSHYLLSGVWAWPFACWELSLRFRVCARNRLLRFGVWQPVSSLRGVGMAFCMLGIVLKVSGLLPPPQSSVEVWGLAAIIFFEGCGHGLLHAGKCP